MTEPNAKKNFEVYDIKDCYDQRNEYVEAPQPQAESLKNFRVYPQQQMTTGDVCPPGTLEYAHKNFQMQRPLKCRRALAPPLP